MRKIIEIATSRREEVIDIPAEEEMIVSASGVMDGAVAPCAHGATGTLLLQENWDDFVQSNLIDPCLQDRQDGNGARPLNAQLAGPSETIPVIGGRLGLSRWQNIFFCEFDRSRSRRSIVCTTIDSER